MTYFAFCIHNHQPAGNFPEVIAEAYENSYLPFLKTLSKYPTLKLTLHTSGFLLDWIAENRPEYIALLSGMVSSGQVEIMGGGHYEPILSVIPECDGTAQIRLMSARIEQIFKTRPKGLWLAERVWEPSLPTMLKKAGVEYILVDDFHFIKSGLEREALGGYYITEDQGNVIKIFPGSERLRYLIPFKPVESVGDYLKNLKGFLRRGNAAIYGDDGEKFGVWPGTHKWVYDEGWLNGFFKWVADNGEWLKPVTLSEYLDKELPLGRVYLPATSYMEMGEWALPPEASKAYTALAEDVKKENHGERISRFLQGGQWRNFLAKYPESNWMHKRMLYASAIVNGAEALAGAREAKGFLFKAQCNDAYWHGVFGGLYLPHLRASVYENLIKAEEAVGQRSPLDVTLFDLDADGKAEVIVKTPNVSLFFSPALGGSLIEMDYLPCAVNVSNTLSRWFEGYHHKLTGKQDETHGHEAKSIHDVVRSKADGLEKFLKFDSRRRASLVEHFIGMNETLKKFSENEHKELGDFCGMPYDVSIDKEEVIFTRQGRVLDDDFFVKKEIVFNDAASFSVVYDVKGQNAPAQTLFGVEFNLMLPCCDGPACHYEFDSGQARGDIGLGSVGEMDALKKITLVDAYRLVSVTIETDISARLWRFPVHTVSLSEAGFERIYQGSCLLFLFQLNATNGGAPLKVRFDVRLAKQPGTGGAPPSA
ncbi:MAG: DUF1926 domain-containing protein [Deltaproteobacteria bacterium]|nr:DUF1926 domain-containing protein [Deltaproteobacteria bacterium]